MNAVRELKVDLGKRGYPVILGRELSSDLIREKIAGRRALAVVDIHVAQLHAGRLADWLPPEIPRLIAPEGEAGKSLAGLERLALDCLEAGLDRDGIIVSVGGGVTSDLAGMLAASYFRGIPFLSVPTTLLAMVDAGIGGKVAVNLPGARNALGFFHQPEAVLMETAFLDTLPQREKRSGLGELAKTAALAGPDFFEALEAGAEPIPAENGEALLDAVWEACRFKVRVVEADERENGPRSILNFGHTLGHAIEASQPRPDCLHGEAVSLGMRAALRIGSGLGLTNDLAARRLEDLLSRWSLPQRLPGGLTPEGLAATMVRDKKNRRQGLGWVLLEDFGRALHGRRVEEPRVLETLSKLI